MKRWGLKSTSECECGAPNQSVQHIMDDCTMHRPPNGERGLTDLDEDTRIWQYQPGNMTIDARKKKKHTLSEIFTEIRELIVFNVPKLSFAQFALHM